jgi:hypothetical protein
VVASTTVESEESRKRKNLWLRFAILFGRVLLPLPAVAFLYDGGETGLVLLELLPLLLFLSSTKLLLLYREIIYLATDTELDE